ncbi:MAG: MDR family MFS transporter [Thermaerobacter sp.]|nr:MDR family MFS transporter [Thermaerobacter sp.]
MVPRTHSKTWIVATILLAMMLTALDMTIVGTAMPSIIASLHGVSLYSWVFSAYLLTSTTPVPIYSKLADMYGRKPVFLAGAALFTVGSALCGAAVNMPELILFRALQGLGAAGVLPVALTIVGDLFTLEQRGRVQGLFSAVWGLAAVVGPLAGAWIVENTSWRWVFEINLPIGLLVLLILWRTFHEVIARRPHDIDLVGAGLMSAAVVLVMAALLQTAWSPSLRSATGLAGLALLAGFLVWETRAPEPVLPLAIFRDRLIALSSVVNLAAGMLMFGLISYLPLFVQTVQGGTPTMAGRAITPMMVAWPITAFGVSPLLMRVGHRRVAVAGGLMIAAGALGVAWGVSASPLVLGIGTALVGSGMGLSLTGLLITLQGAVPWNLRGVVTGTTQFFRTIGGAIGVAAMGALFNQNTMALAAATPSLHAFSFSRLTTVLIVPHLRAALPPEVRNTIVSIMGQSLHAVFLLGIGFAALVLVSVLGLPAAKPSPAEQPLAEEAF